MPHKGWRCVDIEDLGEPSETCEMCEVQSIRYVHTMEHDDYAEPLRCGCVCAGHMEEDVVGARLRETTFKSSRQRRKNWLTREWRRGWFGDDGVWRYRGEYLNVDGFHISTWPRPDGTYAAKVEDRWSGRKRYSQRRYDTIEAAKLAAFDVMLSWRHR